MAMRARIVLSCDEGLNNGAVAKKLQITGAAFCKWRERFRVGKISWKACSMSPGQGAPRSITDKQVEAVITKTRGSIPAGRQPTGARGSWRKKAGLSQTAVVRIWDAFGLQPHRVERTSSFPKISQFIEKVRDIVGLYIHTGRSSDRLMRRQKSQVQALNRTQPILPLTGGLEARRSHDYERHGVTSLFAAMDVASGVTISNCYRRHRHQEFLRFLNDVDANLPRGLGGSSGDGQLWRPQGQQSALLG